MKKKFNIGDKVRRRDGAGHWNDLKEGDIGIVTGYGGFDAVIVNNHTSGHTEHNLVLVQKASINIEIY